MPRNASGVMNLGGVFAVANAVPSSTTINGYITDITDEITASLDRDGKAIMRADLRAGGYKVINVGTGVASDDAATVGQLGAYGSLGTANIWTASQTFRLTDDAATAGPVITLDRISTTPAVNDILGKILFQGKDSANNTTDYASIDARIFFPTDPTENGALVFSVAKNGTNTIRFFIEEGFYGAGATGGNKGPDSVNAGSYYQNGNLGTIMPRNWIDGAILSNNSSDLNNDIDVAAGQCMSDDNTYMITVPAITKQIDALWALGTNAGGRDTGTETNSTWYHVFAIARPDTGVSDVLFSTSVSSPNMPASYTKKRRLGSVFNDPSGNIRAFTQRSDQFLWNDAVIDHDIVNPGVTAVTRTLSVPTGVQVEALLSVGGYQGTAAFSIFMSSLDSNDQTPQVIGTGPLTGFMTGNTVSGNWNFGHITVRTNTLAQVRSRASATGAANRLGIITLGWIDRRGRNA